MSKFYQRYSLHLLIAAALSLPYLTIMGESLPSNNDIETWLPRESTVRSEYEQFKADFGVEELILVGIADSAADPALTEAVAKRIERLEGVRSCWTPARLSSKMLELGVGRKAIDERLQGLSRSANGTMVGLVALLTDHGLAHRGETVADVRDVLEYCQLEGAGVSLAGAPVIVAELDRLGSRENNKRFFLVTLVICLALLYHLFRQWKLTLSLLGLTIWAIQLTMTVIHLAGGEMNFILGALPVMVMIFSLAISIHFVHYYTASLSTPDPLGSALKLAWKPCILATLTTTIGLISLGVSEIGPVRQFGYSASLGSVVALLTGLGLTPAVLTLWPPLPRGNRGGNLFASRPAAIMLDKSWLVAGTTCLLVAGAATGILRLETRIDPLDFLPPDGRVLTDVRRIERELTPLDSIEAVVDFGDSDAAFAERLQKVRQLETRLQEHPAVRHTMSLASFFPARMPDSPLAAARLLNRARTMEGQNEFLAAGDQLWRISARIRPAEGQTEQDVFRSLEARTAGEPIHFTGISPMIEQAQHEIFRGFWESFSMAFLIITAVMIVSLRSLKTGLVAMIPNLTPICIVFGTLGWLKYPVDIGMMMSGSIALGIAVDGTFHFLVRYHERMGRGLNSAAASRSALRQTGAPILQAAVVASIGMLALTLSSFTPTARFGYLMATLLIAALIGDLVLLPALLCLRPGPRPPLRSRPAVRRPHWFKTANSRKMIAR